MAAMAANQLLFCFGLLKYPSKFGSSESTVAPHVLMRGGVGSFDQFMRLEVGDMTPRDTGANKWAYDPRYNRDSRGRGGVRGACGARDAADGIGRTRGGLTSFVPCTEILSPFGDDLDNMVS